MIGADALLKSLENHNINQIFAYPGGAVLPIYDRMPEYGIKRILVRNEQAAAFAAQGISRTSKNTGVCLATSGPGATNLVTGIADAKMDSIPMIAITGNVFKKLIGSDAFQEVDIIGVCEPIVKHSYFVERADDIPQIIEEAFFLANSGRPGPVLIDIPKCVQIEQVSVEIEKKLNENQLFGLQIPHLLQKDPLDVSEISIAADLISKAKKPVVIYGHGVLLSEGEKALQDFLDKSKIPNTWTLHGIGCANGKSPLALGMLGMHGTAAANEAVHEADLIIGIGIRFDDRITGVLEEFQKNNKIIHFDIDPSEFDKNVKADAQILGQIRETLPLLTTEIEEGKEADWHKKLLDTKKNKPLDKSEKMTEIKVLDELFAMIEKDDTVTVDVGQHEMWAAQRFLPTKSKRFLASGGLGSMGFSLPTAMGAAFGEGIAWSISGDGGIQMNIQELATLKQDNIPVKVIILNNSFLGMVRQWQDLFYGKNYVDTPMHNPDFVAVGKAYGIPSFKVERIEDIVPTLQKMKEIEGPVLCEFVVEKETNVLPMVPQGKSLGETITKI